MHPLKEALRVARVILEEGSGELDKDSIALGLKLSPKASTFMTRVASAKHFGLLKKERKVYKTTKLAKKILRPIEEGEEEQGLREAFLTFPAFRELFEKYSGSKIPKRPIFENISQRQFGVSDVSKGLFYGVFVESGKFSNMISETEEGLFCGYPAEVEKERGRVPLPTFNRKLVQLWENIGSLKTFRDVYNKSRENEILKYIEITSQEILKSSLELASDLNLSACKMSLKITLDHFKRDGFEVVAKDFIYIEDGLKEDLGLEKPEEIQDA